MRNRLSPLIIVLCLCVSALFGKPTARRHRVAHARPKIQAPAYVATDTVSADSLLNFARNLIGTPYRPASSSPQYGFDCSGFVSYVFKNFNFNVPRSSCEFIDVGEKIKLEDAKPGDIILFTGTKKHTRRIGHIGIVLYNGGDDFKFIHSTSGKEYGVTITSMDQTYRHRFVQIIRLLKQNTTPDSATFYSNIGDKN